MESRWGSVLDDMQSMTPSQFAESFPGASMQPEDFRAALQYAMTFERDILSVGGDTHHEERVRRVVDLVNARGGQMEFDQAFRTVFYLDLMGAPPAEVFEASFFKNHSEQQLTAEQAMLLRTAKQIGTFIKANRPARPMDSRPQPRFGRPNRQQP
jgi:hypothetical protein